MQMVSQEVSAQTPTVAVIYPEIRAFGPLIESDVCPSFGWQEIGNYTYTVFVVVANQSLVGVGSICPDNSSPLGARLGWVIVWNHKSVSSLYSFLLKFESLTQRIEP